MPPNSTDEAPPEYDPETHYCKLVDGEWTVIKILTQIERYEQGIDPIPEGMKIESGALVAMTTDEKVAAGLLSEEEGTQLSLSEELATLTEQVEELDRKAIRSIRAERAGT